MGDLRNRHRETWLRDNGYRIPPGAARVLGSYIKQGMRFFVARVNLQEQVQLGFSYLRPLQMAYESPKFMLPIRQPQRGSRQPVQGQDVCMTRLHLRYDADHFPEDLTFQETADRTNFQGRYVLRHPWQGAGTCQQAQEYRAGLPQRWEHEARALAALTGWNIEAIRQKMPGNGTASEPQKWWRKLWKD